MQKMMETICTGWFEMRYAQIRCDSNITAKPSSLAHSACGIYYLLMFANYLLKASGLI